MLARTSPMIRKRSSTEKVHCIQGAVKIREMFSNEFHEQLRVSFYHWIELAAAREVCRPLHQIASLLPDTVNEELYSKRAMFGAMPFRKALDLAGGRMIDPRYSHHHKVLLVISDGGFNEDSSLMVVAEMINMNPIGTRLMILVTKMLYACGAIRCPVPYILILWRYW